MSFYLAQVIRMTKQEGLVIKNLDKTYPLVAGGSFDTLDDISLDVQPGEFVSIIGPSGSGKSTLFNIISGLEEPTSGQIFLNGESIIDRKGVTSYMPQQDHLLPWRTVIDNIILGLEIKGYSKRAAKDKASEYLAVFGLSGFEQQYPHMLSGGMRSRAALLRTLLLENELLLLDEPFSALDEITRMQMQQWLLGIWERFRPMVLFVTHSVDEAIYLSDRIYLFSARPARVLAEFTIDLARPRSAEVMVTPEFMAYKQEILQELAQSL